MRVATLFLFGLLAAAGCDRATPELKDLSWGKPFEGDYEALLERTKYVLHRQFQLGLDPDLTNQEEGEFWTVWHYKMSTWYRQSKRERAHVKVDDLGKGRVRIGVSVVSQLNDDIDNPSVRKEARWVKTTRDPERASILASSIARSYLKLEPSELWKEKHRATPRRNLRPDILDRNRDVDLEDLGRIDDPDKEFPDSREADGAGKKPKRKKKKP